MSKTVNEHIAVLQGEFRKLSLSRKAQLAREAKSLPVYMSDDNGFWRGLSAKHVLAAHYSDKK